MNLHQFLPLIFIVSFSAAITRAEIPLTEENVDQAVQRAVEFIKSARVTEEHWEQDQAGGKFYGGDSGLALLALLYADEDPRSSEMSRSLKWFADLKLTETYTVGTRAHVFALVPGKQARSILQKDVDWLMNAGGQADAKDPGAYGYKSGDRRWDNSNSQYGVLGVWMAAEAGVRIKRDYWELVAAHWLKHQGDDGGWGYTASDKSTGAMTAAGLATLYVLYDYLYYSRRTGLGELNYRVEQALDWTHSNFSTENPNGEDRWKYYYLYGVERVGRASGRKYFRDRDWFKVGAAHLLDTQLEDGSWPGESGHGDFTMSHLRNTAFALMFICHGRAPVLFNKLHYIPPEMRDSIGEALPYDPNDPDKNDLEATRRFDWNRHPRDLAGLTRAAQGRFEKLLNWQIITLDSSIHDFFEAPVLYMTGNEAWTFTDDDRKKLREYALRGGLLLAAPADRGTAFVESMKQLAGELFPDTPLEPLPSEHPLISGDAGSTLEPTPTLLAVSHGQRLLMVIGEEDIGLSWQRYRTGQRSNVDLDLGLNTYLYATDKSTPKTRLASPLLADKQVRPDGQVLLARIKHSGNWNPEPYGWLRLATYLQNETAKKLTIGWGITLDSPKLGAAQVAHITGDEPLKLSDAERRGLRKFLTEGGILFADATDGQTAFYDSLIAELQEVLPGDLSPLNKQNPLITGKGIPGATSIAAVDYRRSARRVSRGQKTPQLWVYNLQQQPAVILSPLDVNTGLLGTQVYDCVGYQPDSALKITRNVLMYARLSTFEKSKLMRP
jgi:hypothetical protein